MVDFTLCMFVNTHSRRAGSWKDVCEAGAVEEETSKAVSALVCDTILALWTEGS